MNLFRYSAKKYNDLLLNVGSIRVGTLHDFRRTEHVQGIADPKEGTKRVTKFIEQMEIKDPDDPNLEIMDFKEQFKLGANAKIKFINCSFASNINHPDLFILCASSVRSLETMRQFDGANSCVKINNPQPFFQILTELINEQFPVEFKGVHSIAYMQRTEEWDGNWGHHPALIKEPVFSLQHEVRAIWQPLDGQEITPIICAHDSLATYCQEVSITS